MIRVYIRRKNEITGRVFKSKRSVMKDRVALLHWGYVEKGLITEEEWAKSTQFIKDRFELVITEVQIDGRTKLARSLKPFSWMVLMKKYNGVFNPAGYYAYNDLSGENLEIEISRDNSMVRYRSFGIHVSEWKEIHYSPEGEPYFLMNGKRSRVLYLKDFIKFKQ